MSGPHDTDPTPAASDDVPRIAVVGATGGIGEGVCRELLRRGADVVAVGRDLGRLQELAARLPAGPQARGARVQLVTADATADGDDVRARLAAEVGRVDGVVIAIGSPGRPSPGSVLDIPVGEARRMMEANEIGGLRALQTLVPLVRPTGAVVNLLGYSAEIPFPNNPLMGSTNAAMRSLLMTLADQIRDTGPRIYGLIVGIVRTRARQSVGVDNPAWLTGDQIGAYALELITGDVEEPAVPLRYLLDPARGPSIVPPRR